MDSILITGANGFLGRSILQALSDIYQVVDINHLTQERVDISQPFSLPLGYKTDLVLHMAGKAHVVPKNLAEEALFKKINFEGTKNLCQAIDALEYKPKAFIFISSVSVYGVDEGIEIDEQHSLFGSTPYASSKVLAEKFLQSWAGERNITLGILRLPLIAGVNPPGNLGAMIRGIKSNRYVSIGSALAKKSIVWSEDIVAILPKLAEVGGIYNLTDGYNPTFKELEETIADSLGKPSPPKVPYQLAKIIAYLGDIIGSNAPLNSMKLKKITSSLTFSDRKARKLLGWEPSNVLRRISDSL